MFFIKLLVVDKSEFAPLIGNWPWLREKNAVTSHLFQMPGKVAQQIKSNSDCLGLSWKPVAKARPIHWKILPDNPSHFDFYLMKKAIFVFLFELRDTGMNILSTIMSKAVKIRFAFLFLFFCACDLMLIFSGRGAGQLKIYH